MLLSPRLSRSQMSPDGTTRKVTTVRRVLNSSNFFVCVDSYIRSLKSYFHYVEHHLSLPHIFFTSQGLGVGSKSIGNRSYFLSSYFLYPLFRSKAGCLLLNVSIVLVYITFNFWFSTH